MSRRTVIFVGNFFSPNQLQSVVEDSKGTAAFATHNFEMSLFHGILSHEDVDVKAFVVPSYYSYPKYHKHWRIKSERFFINRTEVHSIGFINLPVIKNIHRSFSLFVSLYKFLKNRKKEDVRILVSCPYSYLLGPLFAVKSLLRRKLDITLLIMDMPTVIQDMDGYKGIKGKIIKRSNASVMKKVEKCDKLVLLTEPMKDFICSEAPYIIVEGLVDVESMSKEYHPLKKGDREIIQYTGTLRAIFGVRNLVDAFEQAELDNAELWICGSGDSKGYIEEKAKKNKNIRFFGLVNAKKALELQSKATILVNPRTSEGEFTKFSFPSKTMEYLLAGKSVIINRLSGIPDEYYAFTFTPDDESVGSLAEELKAVVNTPFTERQEKAKLGREFVMKYKNSHVQAGRVLDLMYR